jgi:hypothetical protein
MRTKGILQKLWKVIFLAFDRLAKVTLLDIVDPQINSSNPMHTPTRIDCCAYHISVRILKADEDLSLCCGFLGEAASGSLLSAVVSLLR